VSFGRPPLRKTLWRSRGYLPFGEAHGIEVLDKEPKLVLIGVALHVVHQAGFDDHFLV
jgi:hypothetical protein